VASFHSLRPYSACRPTGAGRLEPLGVPLRDGMSRDINVRRRLRRLIAIYRARVRLSITNNPQEMGRSTVKSHNATPSAGITGDRYPRGRRGNKFRRDRVIGSDATPIAKFSRLSVGFHQGTNILASR
jgi:hypothetical protein